MARPEKNKKKSRQSQQSFGQVLRKSSLAFLAMSPLLIGIIGLVGLFQVIVTPEMIGSFFKGNPLVDTIIGTFAGATASGNPVISYLLGGELLGRGISLYAVSAFILSWVTLSFIHLPAESEVFGFGFTFLRNILAFIFTMIIAGLTGYTLLMLI